MTSVPAKSSLHAPVSNISVDPQNANATLFCQNNSINLLHKELSINSKAAGKRAKNSHEGDDFDLKVVKAFDTVSF